MKRKKRAREQERFAIPGYDFYDSQTRQDTIQGLFDKAKNARTVVEADWERFNDYYNFIHDTAKEAQAYYEDMGLPWKPTMCPDPWIMVESQIDPTVPEPEFRGRDSDQDSKKAKIREFAVKYILENNDIAHKNTSNERRMLKLGDAFWKVYLDIGMRMGPHEGDIAIADISPEAIYPDPAVRNDGLQSGQYIAYVYSMHRVKFYQTYKEALERMGLDIEEIGTKDYVPRESLLDLSTAYDDRDDTVQVMEFWFKWPTDGRILMPDGEAVEVTAGRVACSFLAGGVEMKLIPDYWKRTGEQNQLFPFVQTWRIRDENSFWNKSELYPILPMVDAQDRKLEAALLNDQFMSNDIVLVEEGALAEGQELTNEPGQVLLLKNNKINSVRRLGGLHDQGNATVMLNYLKEQIERTNRNYETNLGKETSRQTTAAGLAMLREDSAEQGSIKTSDRKGGFERLFTLVDWSALEFYDDNRLLYLGADKEKQREEAQQVRYNSDDLTDLIPEVRDAMTGEIVREERHCWPKIDVSIVAGDSVVKGKQATLSALGQLTQAAVTEDNWRLYAAQLDILDIPEKQKIIDGWQEKFGSSVPKELLDALNADPQLLQQTMMLAQAAQMQQAQMPAPEGGAYV